MKPAHDNDDVMMEEFRKGESGAFMRIYDEWYDKLVYFAKKIIGDEAGAEDITSNVFTSLFVRRKNFYTLNNVKAYLYISVNHRCNDYLRDKKDQSNAHIAAYNQQGTTDVYVLSKMIQLEFITEIYNEIERLPGKEKQVVKLYFIEGLSVQKIASTLDMTPDAVTSAKRRGVKKLREIIIDKNLISLTGSALFCFREILSYWENASR